MNSWTAGVLLEIQSLKAAMRRNSRWSSILLTASAHIQNSDRLDSDTADHSPSLAALESLQKNGSSPSLNNRNRPTPLLNGGRTGSPSALQPVITSTSSVHVQSPILTNSKLSDKEAIIQEMLWLESLLLQHPSLDQVLSMNGNEKENVKQPSRPLYVLNAPVIYRVFLMVIQSPETTGPITATALQAVESFISRQSFGLNSVQDLNSIIQSCIHCRFDPSDAVSDEIVLLRLLMVRKTVY